MYYSPLMFKGSLANLAYQQYLKGILPHVIPEDYIQEVFNITEDMLKETGEIIWQD